MSSLLPDPSILNNTSSEEMRLLGDTDPHPYGSISPKITSRDLPEGVHDFFETAPNTPEDLDSFYDTDEHPHDITTMGETGNIRLDIHTIQKAMRAQTPSVRSITPKNTGQPVYIPPLQIPIVLTINTQEPEEDDVSEQFVEEFNNHIGNEANYEKAQRLIRKMKCIGGLEHCPDVSRINIPNARLGFCILAGLDDQELKMQALEGLLQLLQSDPLTRKSSVHLVSLGIKLMQTMNRELMQTEIIEVQIKIAQVYSAVVELLLQHYAKKHINGITEELKNQLTYTINALKRLNRQENTKVSFFTHCAIQGALRLKDDNRKLLHLLERLYYVSGAATSIVFKDGYGLYAYLSAAFAGVKDLSPITKSAWYNAIIVAKDIGKKAKTDLNELASLQILIHSKYKVLNWKFTYAAMEILCDICLHGETEQIRHRAFYGIKQLEWKFPGLASFADCIRVSRHIDITPMIRLESPRIKNPNLRIREGCVEFLKKIALNAEDETLRKKADLILAQRDIKESNDDILEALKSKDSLD